MNKNPSGTFYRHILAEAWSVMKRGKVLWLLGFFVSFLGNGGVYELLIQGTGRLGLSEDFGGAFALIGILPEQERFVQALEGVGAFNALIFILISLTVLALMAVSIWVVVSAQGGLISGIRDQAKGKTPTFAGSFAAGNEVFWPLFSLNLLSRIAVTACFYLLLALLILLMAKTALWSSLAYLIGFLVLIPLTVIIGFVTIYAAGYVTLQRLPFIQALEAGIALFRKYWLISIETALILLGINILCALALGAGMGVLGLALLPLIFGASLLGGGVAIFMALAVILGIVLLMVVGSGLAAFQYSVWTLLFLKLHQRGHGGVAKLTRWFGRLVG